MIKGKSKIQLALWAVLFMVAMCFSAYGADGQIKIAQTAGTTFPITINESGSYVLTSNLTVTTANVKAININADNVTLDLNGHTIHGFYGGATETGIYAYNRYNIAIKNGIVRGFCYGIYLFNDDDHQGAGHRIEGIQASNNGGYGIYAPRSTVTNCTAAFAEVIDFESIPGGSPSDGLTISTQFLSTHGVTFSRGDGGSPVLAQVGAPRTAFQGYNLLPDQPAPGTNVGQFFLTDDGVVSGPPSPLLIDYTTVVAAAGGVIIDIDGQEEWTVEAFNDDGAIIGTVILGPNNTLDGSATHWSFDFGTPVIKKISLSYTGAQTSGVGLAFDNFTPSSPVPICDGDFDHDGDVDGSDLATFAADFGRTDCAGDCEGDFDYNGKVDVSDLAIFAADFGRTDCPCALNVP